MSFHSSLVTALKTDIVSALTGAGRITTAAQVYEGRRPQKTTSETGEVWIEPQPAQDRARGGGNADQLHVLRVHRRVKSREEGNQTGAAQVSTLVADLETLRQRWSGYGTGVLSVTGLVAMQASEASVDEDPADMGVLDGYLELRVLEKAS